MQASKLQNARKHNIECKQAAYFFVFCQQRWNIATHYFACWKHRSEIFFWRPQVEFPKYIRGIDAFPFGRLVDSFLSWSLKNTPYVRIAIYATREFFVLFTPASEKFRSRARLRARDLISLKGVNEKLPRSHIYFFGQWAATARFGYWADHSMHKFRVSLKNRVFDCKYRD